MPVPFSDIGIEPIAQVFLGSEVGNPEAFALQDAKPLLDLVHPRAVDGGKVKHETRVAIQPSPDLFPRMGPEIIAHDMDPGNFLGDGAIQMPQECDQLKLSLAAITLAIHLAGSSVEGSKEVERTLAAVFVLDQNRFARLCWKGRLLADAGLKRGFLVEAQNDLVFGELPGV